MLSKMIRNDIRKNKAINVILCLFITLAAMLVSGAFSIIVEMMGAMDSFFEAAQPAHYLQMVSEDFDQKAIDDFAAGNDLVKACQTAELLTIDNSYIFYGDTEQCHSSSVMENSFVKQSPSFDYLLDENNNIIRLGQGQIAVPLYTIDTFGLKKGDTVTVREGGFDMAFVITAFVRDSQMNPSLVSSKRFVVSDADFELLRGNVGEMEYMIEFLLTDATKTSTLESAYLEAGLPSGIAITLPIIRIMNATTGGLPAVVFILAGLLLIVIAMACLRFTILTTMEEESRQIGVMRAIGLAPKHIRRLYLTKYYLISVVSCVAGFVFSLMFGNVFTQSVTFYMGSASSPALSFFLSLLGALTVFVIVACSCGFVLRRLRKMQVVDAIRGTGGKKTSHRKAFPIHKSSPDRVNITLGARDVVNRLRSYITPIIVFMLCAFLLIVPTNFLNTIKSPDFAGYIGAGHSDLLVSMRPAGDGEHVAAKYDEMLNSLENDKDVALVCGSVTVNYKMKNPDNEYENIRVKIGDFSLFPVPYIDGGAPSGQDEMALAYLTAKNMGASVGDRVVVLMYGAPKSFTVSGIYQDLTNGGKSAQANFPYKTEDILWYDVSVNLTDGVDIEQKAYEINTLFAPANAVAVDSYMAQTFGSTISQLERVTWIVAAIATVIAVLITALFFKMLLAKDAGQITIMKGLGFTAEDIRKQYITAFVLSLIIGVVLGTLAAATLGEGLVGLLISSMGTSHIDFVVNPLTTYIIYPLLLLSAVVTTTVITAKSIRKNRNYIIAE
jgi:ABC-type antimicrobial peptide transport system, permease component